MFIEILTGTIIGVGIGKLIVWAKTRRDRKKAKQKVQEIEYQKAEDPKDRQNNFSVKFERMTTHCSKRLFENHDINNDELGYFYTYGEKETHKECYDCSKEFTEGDHVYLTNYFHDFDVITPFPYCKSCIQKHLVYNNL